MSDIGGREDWRQFFAKKTKLHTKIERREGSEEVRMEEDKKKKG